jgi:hypothetical protein
MRYRWKETARTGDLTVTVFGRNLVDLHYPFVESLISTIPLGCRYLVGTCPASDDGRTRDCYRELAKYVPMDFVEFDWPLDAEPGWGAVAIGICTQRTMERARTEYVLNVQACEVLTDGAVNTVLEMAHPRAGPGRVGPLEFRFNHFYGSMHHGGPGYGGYPHAPRLLGRDTKIDRTDGWVPNDYNGGYPIVDGWINRYGHCFVNNIRKKMANKVALYFGDAEPHQVKIDGLLEMRKTRVWHGAGGPDHPACVHHLLEMEDYEAELSLGFARRFLL